MAVLEKIKLVDLSGGNDCELFNYGNMTDPINHFSYEFTSSNIYGIIGEFGNGGWGLSYVMAGKEPWHDGKIFINNVEINYNTYCKIGCYIGDKNELKRKYHISKMTVKEQIEYGIKRGSSFCNDIKKYKKSLVYRMKDLTAG